MQSPTPTIVAFRGGPWDGRELRVSQAPEPPVLLVADDAAPHVRHRYKSGGWVDDHGRTVYDYVGAEETRPPTLPGSAWFEYNRTHYPLRRVSNEDAYGLQCPLCGARSFLTHAPGTHHTVTVGPNGALTATPSIRCPNDTCSWHVWIELGHARDA